jgi:hypothetical protein
MRYKNGEPGRTPYTFGPLMCGADPGGGVRISPTGTGDGALVSADLTTANGLNDKEPIRRIFWILFFMVDLRL